MTLTAASRLDESEQIKQRRAYYRTWLQRSIKASLLACGFKGRAETLRVVVIWAMSVLGLYRVDWSKVPVVSTGDAGASSEVRLALCGIAGIVLVFLITFVWQVLAQPALMDEERAEELRLMKAEVEATFQAEAVLQKLSDLHREGYAVYHCEAPPEIWEQRMADWSKSAEALIREHFSVAAVHRYRSPGNGFSKRTSWSWPEEHGELIWLKATYTGFLNNLDELIQHGSPVFLSKLARSDRRRMAEISQGE